MYLLPWCPRFCDAEYGEESAEEVEISHLDAMILVTGARRSGKSSLVRSLQGAPFDLRLPQTVGLDFQVIEYPSNNKIQVWDIQSRTVPMFYTAPSMILCKCIIVCIQSTSIGEPIDHFIQNLLHRIADGVLPTFCNMHSVVFVISPPTRYKMRLNTHTDPREISWMHEYRRRLDAHKIPEIKIRIHSETRNIIQKLEMAHVQIFMTPIDCSKPEDSSFIKSWMTHHVGGAHSNNI